MGYTIHTFFHFQEVKCMSAESTLVQSKTSRTHNDPEPKGGSTSSFHALPLDHLERVDSWGMNKTTLAYVYRPATVDGILDVFKTAKDHGRTVGLRGGGRSYGDASLSAENVTLDLTRMNRILAWNPETGIVKVEPGVTLRQLWQYCIEDGWWPPVVSGTMFVTLGGAAAMNFHGKNNFKMGPIGDHITEFELLTPAGLRRVCSRSQNPKLFHAAIGGFGMLGCFITITLQMKKVYSGNLSVYALSTRSMAETICEFESRMDSADYLVGWIDCFASGRALGRGLIHQANYLSEGQDPRPAQTLRVVNQELPETIFGIIPKSIMWRCMKPLANNPGMKLLNWAKYTSSAILGNHKRILQSHTAFAFLLDYVPDWKFVYKPNGLIQYQSFIPADNAEACFTRQLELCHEAKIIPFLGVFKRHKKDNFSLTHSVDGYSFALDFPITDRNRVNLWKLAERLNEIVLESGGRFYFAKDSTLNKDTAEAYLGKEVLEEFWTLKQQCDPDGILKTDLAHRIFGL